MLNKRAPSTPLIVHDPFFSIWSSTDNLTDSWPSHWTGRPQAMCGLIRIDGVCYRFMGQNTKMAVEIPALEQVSCEILPTQTKYQFRGGGVRLFVTFTTPSLPKDPQLLARPVTYVDCVVESADGSSHDIQLHFDISATVCTDQTEAPIVWGRHQHGQTMSLWCGAEGQAVLGRTGDECFTDWGYLHLSPEPNSKAIGSIGEARSLRSSFAEAGCLPNVDGFDRAGGVQMPAPASGGEGRSIAGYSQNRQPLMVLAISTDLGPTKVGSASVAVAYDHVAQIEYLERRIPPLWRRQDHTAIAMIARAWSEKVEIVDRCDAFNTELIADMSCAAGAPFARLGALAFRQCLGGHALVDDEHGKLLHFSKENSSNGCMGTVDLTYPAAPFFLLFNPELLAAQMRFIFRYAASERWQFPFAPHDIGRYPLANGQVYGGGETGQEDQMPFEECGNMLILSAALGKTSGDFEQFRDVWPLLEQWANYLVEQGFDPGEQLCTDDFDGHMAHNANLSAKGIIAIGAAAQIAKELGKVSSEYRIVAEDFAAKWIAVEKDEAHYRMCFDQPNSWSLKYNLIWDRFLDLKLFDQEILDAEMHHYQSQMNLYGVPLHSVADHTKLDWLIWAACLSGNEADRDKILRKIDCWLDTAPERVPLSDWFDTQTGRQARNHGFHARPVVGGVFMPMLLDSGLLTKWSK